jgi:formamidopyrimidine-DNA glycosylase
MPELPDIVAYQEAIARHAQGTKLLKSRIYRPFLVRTFSPPANAADGLTLTAVERMGKRIVLAFEDRYFFVFHLMIAGRFSWGLGPSMRPSKFELASLQFESGTLTLTEAGSKRRASLHIFESRAEARTLDRGGLEPLEAPLEQFELVLTRENRTLKRALTNPHAFGGIGNAYSDEILFEARLSPMRLTQSLNASEIKRLYEATRSSLRHWTEVIRKEVGDGFPGRGKVTAFRKDFNVHGRYGEPCRACGMPIQRIVYAENEANYCARCQNEDRVLADRALSRLLKDDWPKTIEDMAGE